MVAGLELTWGANCATAVAKPNPSAADTVAASTQARCQLHAVRIRTGGCSQPLDAGTISRPPESQGVRLPYTTETSAATGGIANDRPAATSNAWRAATQQVRARANAREKVRAQLPYLLGCPFATMTKRTTRSVRSMRHRLGE